MYYIDMIASLFIWCTGSLPSQVVEGYLSPYPSPSSPKAYIYHRARTYASRLHKEEERVNTVKIQPRQRETYNQHAGYCRVSFHYMEVQVRVINID